MTLLAEEKPSTVGEARRSTAERLTRAGVPNADGEARELAARALGVDRCILASRDGDPLPAEARTVLGALTGQRLAGWSLPHVIGEWDFMDFTLTLTPDVLVPRPETEELVSLACERLSRVGPPSSPSPLLIDVGTGSGAIAIALASRWPAARVVAIDISPWALAVARWNARRHGMDERISFLQGDLLDPHRRSGGGRAWGVVANLPYVAAGERPDLSPEVRREPWIALDGGPDGLALFRRLAGRLEDVLGPGGQVFLEVGMGQAASVVRILAGHGWPAEVVRDTAGVDRFVTAVRTSSPPVSGADR